MAGPWSHTPAAASAITKEVLLSEELQEKWVQKELETVRGEGLDGLNIDYEDPLAAGSAEQNGLSKLVRKTHSAFKSENISYQVRTYVPKFVCEIREIVCKI